MTESLVTESFGDFLCIKSVNNIPKLLRTHFVSIIRHFESLISKLYNKGFSFAATPYIKREIMKSSDNEPKYMWLQKLAENLVKVASKMLDILQIEYVWNNESNVTKVSISKFWNPKFHDCSLSELTRKITV